MKPVDRSALHIRFLLLILGLLLAGVPAAVAEAPAEGSAPVAEATAADADDPLAQQMASLAAGFEDRRAEIRAIDELAGQALGDDKTALQAAAFQLRLSQIDNVTEVVTAIEEFEAGGGDASRYRIQLADFLPRMTDSIQAYSQVLRTSIAGLQGQLETADAGARAELLQQLRREEDGLLRILAAGVDQVSRLEILELPPDEARAWVAAQLSERARLMSGRMTLATEWIADAEVRLAARADDADARDDLITAQLRLDHSIESLSEVVPLMAALGHDASRYKGMLIRSTGEITTDVFDQGVAGHLVGRWIETVGESVAVGGPRVAFQTLIFVLLILIFWGLSRFVRTVTERAVEAPHLRFSTLLKRMIVSLASGLVMIVGALVALSQLGFQVGPMVAGLGIAGFIVGFALQETLGNFAAGIMILTYRPFDVGDLIECAGGAVFGKVNHMNLVSTTVLTLDNQTRVVPNAKIWGDVITNVTAQDVRRVDLVFGISYSDDIPKAEEVLWSIVKEHPKVVNDPEPVVKVHELGDSSVNFVVRPWAERDDYWDVHWDITREVKMRFDRTGISIPFPQQDVHFHPVTTNGSGEPQADAPVVYGDSDSSAQDAPDES